MQETADLVTFTEETLIGKLHFLCSGGNEKTRKNVYDLQEILSETKVYLLVILILSCKMLKIGQTYF